MTRFKPFLKPALHKELAEYILGEKIVPINVEMSLTGICNANCPWCFYKDAKTTSTLPVEIVTKTIKEFAEIGVKAITWTGGGEPTMHPNFEQIVLLASNNGIKQGLITNGLKEVTFDPTLFEWIRISKTNKPINETNASVLRRCNTLGIAVNYNGNDTELYDEVLPLAEKIGVNYVQARPILNRCGITEQAPPPKKHPLLIITNYKFEDAKKVHGYKKCEAFHFTPFIWEDGDVDVCGYMKGIKGYKLGNIIEESFADIMSRAPQFVPVCDKCQVCCKPHELNKLIHELRDIEDGDFI